MADSTSGARNVNDEPGSLGHANEKGSCEKLQDSLRELRDVTILELEIIT